MLMPEGFPASVYRLGAGGLDPGYSALFPSRTRRAEIDDWLTISLADAAAAVKQGRVTPLMGAVDYTARLQTTDFDTPREIGDVLSWIIEEMCGGVVHVDHPRYFGLFNPTPTFPAQCAERIAAAFNPQLATATTSPFPVALEAFLIRAIAARAGMPAGTAGHFTTGGSEANATAVICALTRAEAGFAQHGSRAFRGPPRVYASKAAHLAWLKIAHQTGIGRSAVCLIDTDGAGRMNPETLDREIAADIARGHVPVLIASTAGTTGAGMIDPLASCGEIARRHRIWHHVDAAWGGALIVSDRLRPLLRGIETADSVTIDAHKWLGTTMSCGMFLTPHEAALSGAFQVIMDCMPSNAATLDPYVTTLQWSRRFLGLRLFAALATAGWQGYATHVEKSVGLARIVRNALAVSGWECVNDPALAVLCLRPPPNSPPARMITNAVTESGAAWISTVEFEGEEVVRICITSGITTEEDVGILIASLNKSASHVPAR